MPVIVLIYKLTSTGFVCMMMLMASSRPLEDADGEIPTGPNWLELPREVTSNILQRLSTVEIVMSACVVCPQWWNICKDPLMWRTIRMTKIRYSNNSLARRMINCDISTCDLVKICRYAVERSSGQLEEIDIEDFCTDNLLNFIADCTSRLRRLRLANCRQGISDKGLIVGAKKLPLLEELDLSGNKIFSLDALEVIGRCCPLLKSLKVLNCFPIMFMSEDFEAFIVAKTMPGLLRLEISHSIITNVGLLAILDGCPFLEYLDMQGCPHHNWSESLKRRCSEQIKELRMPSSNNNLNYYIDHYLYDEAIIEFFRGGK